MSTAPPGSTQPATLPRRARSDEQKALRRRAILEAADAHFAEGGFEAFSMAELARRAGIVKGTLYLYFETREEVLLTLFCEKLSRWCRALDTAVKDGDGDAEFASAFYEAACADEAFLRLTSRLDSVIEHNVSLETLIESKRLMAREMGALAEVIAPRLGLSEREAYDVLASLAYLLLGACQTDTGPQLEDAEVPDDVRRFMDAFSSRDVFFTNACRILAGVRAGR
jgi:AcrR family transcriptional regulator